MKTKPFLLATAGSTVDGRVIDEKMMEEMASSYDPATYGARLNIEHIRGISPDKPFHCYGDVLELSVGEVEVNFNGQKEKRKGLYGVFDVMDNAKQINDAGQKVYPSIEIEHNFGGKGFAYMMGCALTDSPAAIGTERLKFSRSLPGTTHVYAKDCGIEAAALEFAEDKSEEAGKTFLTGLSGILDKFADKFGGKAAETEPPKKDDPAPVAMTGDDFKAFFTEFGTTMQTFVGDQIKTVTASVDAVKADFTALESKIDGTPDNSHTKRPPSNGTGNFAMTDC